MFLVNDKKFVAIFVVFLLLLNFAALPIAFVGAATEDYLHLKWSANIPPSTGGVLIADINGDGFEDIICAGTGQVVAFNGDGSQIWSVSVTGAEDDMDAQMADLDKDGSLEIIVPVKRPAGIHVLNSDGSTFWRTTGLGGSVWSSPVVADIDGDGYPEIFVAAMCTIVSQSQKTFLEDARISRLSWDGQVELQTFVWHVCAGGLSIDDTDGDGRFELYAGDRNIGYDGFNTIGDGVISFWADTLERRWNDSQMLCSSHIPMLVDVDGDGNKDVIVGHHNGGLAVYNTDGSIIRKQLNLANSAPIHYQQTIFDIDGDGNLEILMADGSHTGTTNDVVIWDLVNWGVDWRVSAGQSYYGPRVADVTGDGILDLIICTFNGIQVWQNNLNNNYELVAEIEGLAGWLTYPVVQDIDNDGLLELVVSSTYGRMWVYDTPAPVPSTRIRSEVQFYGEQRLGAAIYYAPPGGTSPIVKDPSPSDGEADVPISLSELSFDLVDFQGDLMDYTVTTTPNIGTDSGTGVGNGRYSVAVSGLDYGTSYSWTVSVDDGTEVTIKDYSFTTISMPAWWNTDWQYRKTIAIDPAQVTEDQTDFPVLVDVVDSDLMGKAQLDGDDIVFVDENTVKLSHEIESYDSTTGHLTAWVSLPYISSSSFTTFFMYYGNPAAPNQEDSTAVWDTSYKTRMVGVCSGIPL